MNILQGVVVLAVINAIRHLMSGNENTILWGDNMQENKGIIRGQRAESGILIDDNWILDKDLFEEVVKPFINKDFEQPESKDGVFMTSQ